MEKEKIEIEKTVVDSELQEVRQHGRSGFPIAIYEDNFAYFEKGFICWHWHEEVQFSVVKEEKIIFEVAGKSFILEPGDAIFINSQALHQIRPCRPLQGSIYSYIFKAIFLEHNVLSEIYRESVQPVLRKKEWCLVFKKGKDEKILDLLTEMRRIYFDQAQGYQIRVKGLACELWYTMLEKEQFDSETLLPKDQRDIERVKTAIAYIGENYKEKIMLEEIAFAAAISKSELCRCFKRVLNTTPVEYLIQHRVLEAARLLSESDHSITEIAQATGFDSVGHLGRFFKKYIGCSPRGFRKSGIFAPSSI